MVKVCDCRTSDFCESFRFPESLRYLGCSGADDWYGIAVRMSESNLPLNGVIPQRDDLTRRTKSDQFHEVLQRECRRYHELIGMIQDQMKEENSNFSSKIEKLQRQLVDDSLRCEAVIAELEEKFQEENTKLDCEIEGRRKQLLAEHKRYDAEVENHQRQLCLDEQNLDAQIGELREESQLDDTMVRRDIDIIRKSLLDQQRLCDAEVFQREEQFLQEKQRFDGEIEKLRKALQLEDVNGGIEQRQRQLVVACIRYEAEVAEREKQFSLERQKIDSKIEKLRKVSLRNNVNVSVEIGMLEVQRQDKYSSFTAEIAGFKKQSQRIESDINGEIKELQKQQQANASVRVEIKKVQKQLQDKSSSCQAEIQEWKQQFLKDKANADSAIGGLEKILEQVNADRRVGIKIFEEKMQVGRNRWQTYTVERQKQFLNETADLGREITVLQERLQVIRSRNEREINEREKEFLKEMATLGALEELRNQLPDQLQAELKAELSSFEALVAELEKENAHLRSRVMELEHELEDERTYCDASIAEREKFFQGERSRYESAIVNRDKLFHRLQGERHRHEEQKAELERRVASQAQDQKASQAEIKRLVKQLEVAELRNSIKL